MSLNDGDPASPYLKDAGNGISTAFGEVQLGGGPCPAFWSQGTGRIAEALRSNLREIAQADAPGLTESHFSPSRPGLCQPRRAFG